MQQECIYASSSTVLLLCIFLPREGEDPSHPPSCCSHCPSSLIDPPLTQSLAELTSSCMELAILIVVAAAFSSSSPPLSPVVFLSPFFSSPKACQGHSPKWVASLIGSLGVAPCFLLQVMEEYGPPPIILVVLVLLAKHQ